MKLKFQWGKYMKKDEFTGYVIRKNYNLNNLKKYGFFKTEPAEINPWWQRPFNITWNVLGTWDCELSVNKEDRKLLMKSTEGCNLDGLNSVLEEMKKDGVFVNND